jgi:hypothetical protein
VYPMCQKIFFKTILFEYLFQIKKPLFAQKMSKKRRNY